jgi:hypothetical protein
MSDHKRIELSKEDINLIITKLNAKRRGKAGEYICKCPFPDHTDNNPSFTFNINKGVYHCFGCGRKGSLTEILELIKTGKFKKEEEKQTTKMKTENNKAPSGGGKKRKEKKIYTFEEVKEIANRIKEKEGWEKVVFYQYYDIDGVLRYTRVRFQRGKEKTFKVFFHTEDTRLFFYNIISIKFEDQVGWYNKIYFAEGEKCTEKLMEHIPEWEDDVVVLGYSTVEAEIETFKDWIEEGKINPLEVFGGKEIYIFVDHDKPGKTKAFKLLEFVRHYAPLKITLIEFHDKPEKYDIADYLEEGGDIDTAITHYGTTIEGGLGFFGSPMRALQTHVPPPQSILGKLNIPKGITALIGGAGGVGKSTVAFSLMALFNLTGKRVAYLMLEDDPKRVGLYRYQQIVGKILYHNFCIQDDEECFSTRCEGHLEFLKELDINDQIDRQWCKKDLVYIAKLDVKYDPDYLPSVVEFLFKQGFDVVFVDPVGYLLKDENNNEYAQQMLSKLNDICSFYEKNVFLVHHTSKEGWKASTFTSREEFANSIRGASAWVNNVRYGLFIKRRLQGGWLAINFKNNLMPFQDFVITNIYSDKAPIEINLVDFVLELEKEKETKKEQKKATKGNKKGKNTAKQDDIDTSIYDGIENDIDTLDLSSDEDLDIDF